jgi:hydroxymethylpyrimidine pyrophosphatase-like HAD family hydrolase
MNISTSQPKKVLFLSDLDGTWLSPNKANRAALDEGVKALQDEYRPRGIDLEFGYVTARPPERVAKENLPTPSYTITFNGGRIDQGSGVLAAKGGWTKSQPLNSWEELNKATGFTATQALGECKELLATGNFGQLTVQTIGEVIQNPAADDCDYAAHLCFDLSKVELTEAEKKDANGNQIPDIFEPETFEAPAQLKALTGAMHKGLDQDGYQHEISPLYLFHGKPYAMVDVATPLANKGVAVDFLRQQQGVDPENLIIAGDGGNDISMMRDPKGKDDGRRAIVVGPETKLRQAAKGLSHAILAPADKDCSLGVLDGLRTHLEQIAAEG